MKIKPEPKKVESNEKQRQAEIILRVVPVALAGGGPVTKTILFDEWLETLANKTRIPVRRIGVAADRPDFVDERMTGKFYPLDRTIEPADTISRIYENVYGVIKDELTELYESGYRYFLAVTKGYTSYLLFGLKKALEQINAQNPKDPMAGRILMEDCSFPDTDVLSQELDERGYPVTRFHGPSFQSTPYLEVVFAMSSPVFFDIKNSKRVPDGCSALVCSMPYTPRYMENLKKIGEQSKSEARTRLFAELPGWEKIDKEGLLIPFLTSDIWSPDSIGKWMTREQHDTVVEGTANLVRALVKVSRKMNKTVYLPMVNKGADFIISFNFDHVYTLETLGQPEAPAVALVSYVSLQQPDYFDLIAASDLVINRTAQSNSFAETIIVSTPQVVLTLPAAGYMEAEISARSLNRGVLEYNTPFGEMAEEMVKILNDPDYRKNLLQELGKMLYENYVHPDTNFGNLIAKTAGLTTFEINKNGSISR